MKHTEYYAKWNVRERQILYEFSAALQASLSIINTQSPPKPMSIESVMPSGHLILCLPLLLLPWIPPSIRIFSSESTLRIRWPKYWSFSFNISPSNEHPGLISFRMDWLDLLAVQGTLKGNNVISLGVTDDNQTNHGDHFVIYRNNSMLWTGN